MMLLMILYGMEQVMEELNLGDLVGQPYGAHQHFSVSINNFFDTFMSKLYNQK